ncbi:hypothetical protein [Flavobacterium beibuense]|nr:hypothetical protein [Flavobacterium beibuense]
MKTFFKILLLAAVVTSCDDVEPTIFHGDDPAEQTFLSFSSGTYSLPIERNATGTSTVTLTVSTISTVDRTYNIEVIAGSANPATYSVPTSVTILAGEYTATFNITGTDNNLVNENIKTFEIKVSEASITGESLGDVQSTVNVYEVCPLQAPFLGTYKVTSTSAIFNNVFPFGNGVNIELLEGSNPYERVFFGNAYAGYGSTQRIPINFQCDYLNLGANLNAQVGCGEEDGDGNPIYIWLEPADVGDRAPYNTNNEGSFTMNFIENARGACEAPSELNSATFVKQ